MVPGELTFEEIYGILTELFDLDPRSDHYFKIGRRFIGPEHMFNDEGREDWNLFSRFIKKKIICTVFPDKEMTISWLRETRQETDCPKVIRWEGDADRSAEVNEWLEYRHYLLAEVDGNPKGKRYVFREELVEDIADAFLSEDRLTFCMDLYDSKIVVLEKHKDYERITAEDLEEDENYILIRTSDEMYLYDFASEFSGERICDHSSFEDFNHRFEEDLGWDHFRECRIREVLRKWVRDNDLWINRCMPDDMPLW